jgi:RimJ/RimL family protein N-acetyltransferase
VAEFHLETERLLLRGWRAADRPLFAELNSDPAVTEFLGSRLSPAESDDLVERFEKELKERGYCPWAVEEKGEGVFVGFVGLHSVPENLPFAPGVEVGWRLSPRFWGRGYATEAGREALRFGVESLGIEEFVSFTAVRNVRSRRVMERLAMWRDKFGDFEHPALPKGHPLRHHVLYRLRAAEWQPG